MRKCRFCGCQLTGTEVNVGTCSDCLEEQEDIDAILEAPSWFPEFVDYGAVDE